MEERYSGNATVRQGKPVKPNCYFYCGEQRQDTKFLSGFAHAKSLTLHPYSDLFHSIPMVNQSPASYLPKETKAGLGRLVQKWHPADQARPMTEKLLIKGPAILGSLIIAV